MSPRLRSRRARRKQGPVVDSAARPDRGSGTGVWPFRGWFSQIQQEMRNRGRAQSAPRGGRAAEFPALCWGIRSKPPEIRPRLPCCSSRPFGSARLSAPNAASRSPKGPNSRIQNSPGLRVLGRRGTDRPSPVGTIETRFQPSLRRSGNLPPGSQDSKSWATINRASGTGAASPSGSGISTSVVPIGGPPVSMHPSARRLESATSYSYFRTL